VAKVLKLNRWLSRYDKLSAYWACSRCYFVMLSMSFDQLQNQTEDTLHHQLMNLLSDKANYEAAAKVLHHVPDRFPSLLVTA